MVGQVEFRFAELVFRDGGATVEGAAMVYRSTAKIMDAFTESVEPGAFTYDDVTLNEMHRRDRPVARTEGGGLELFDSPERLTIRATIPDYRSDLRDMIARRIYRGMSVEMLIDDEYWPEADRRVIRSARLTGVAIVDRAAYDATTLGIVKRMSECPTATSPFPLIV